MELTAVELRLTAELGLARRITSLFQGLQDRRISQNAWDIDINGAIGEYAVAKALGILWEPTIGTFKLPDVGDLYVRTTTVAAGKLIIRPGDPYGVYVLVITNAPRVQVVGWTSFDNSAQFSKYLSKPNPSGPECWAIPQRDLNPIERLK